MIRVTVQLDEYELESLGYHHEDDCPEPAEVIEMPEDLQQQLHELLGHWSFHHSYCLQVPCR